MREGHNPIIIEKNQEGGKMTEGKGEAGVRKGLVRTPESNQVAEVEEVALEIIFVYKKDNQ